MPSKPRKLKKYIAPAVQTVPGKPIGQRTTLHTFDPPLGGRIRRLMIKRGITRPELNLIEKLRRAGVRVERPFMEKKGIAVFRREGQMLAELKNVLGKRPNRIIRSTIFTHVSTMLGKMHARKISHGHPHDRNIVIDSHFKPTLIDFKLAREHPELNWESLTSIRSAFKEDWKWWAETLFEYGYEVHKVLKLFQTTFQNYPCSQQVKQQLPTLLMETLHQEGVIQTLP